MHDSTHSRHPRVFRTRSRTGFSALSMLISVLVLAFLVTSVPKKFWKELNPQNQVQEANRVTDLARNNVWMLLGTEVRNAAETFEITFSRKPQSFEDLNRIGMDTSKRGPWGGRLYIKDGYLRSSKNKEARIKVID